MGCNVSRIQANGAAAAFKRLQLGRRPLKDSTLSKKELLSLDQEDVNLSINSSNGKPRNTLEEIIKKPDPIQRTEIKIETAPIKGVGVAIIIAGHNYGIMKAKQDEAFGGDEEEDDNDDERMIGYGDGGGGFPASPSFRIYFQENLEDSHNEMGKNNQAFNETVSIGDIVPPKELSSQVEKKVKRERIKRCFRKVLPKRGQGAVKNILNMKSCCS